jgi:predicted dehydrogenase
MFNLAIVGLGPWGQRLIESVQSSSDSVHFSAAATRTPSKVEEFCTTHGMTVTDNYQDILGNPEIDGIVVAGPAALHASHGMEALEAGKHTLIIKPFAKKRDEAEALCKTARDRGVLVALGFDRCFTSPIDELRRHVRAGDLGRIIHAEGDFCVDRYLGFDANDWKGDSKIVAAGALADHMLYTMIELMGPVAELQVRRGPQITKISSADTATVTLAFKSGASGLLTAIGVTPNFHRLHLFGTEGWAEVRGNRNFEFRPREGEPTATEFPPANILKRELEIFAAAAIGEATFPLSDETVIAAVAALEAMAVSEATGEAVTV